MSFPSKKKLDKIKEKLKNKEGFQMLSPDADELAKLRFRVCQDLLKYAKKNKLTATEMADILSIPGSDMSRIFNHNIERFSTDKLLKLYAIAYPDYKLKVS
jgi:predicted XRE-type DNA-binding protein